MKLRSLRVGESPELMIIPMIDIIFFLLVFFMLHSLSMIEQRTLPVQLPQAAQTQAEKRTALDITVLKDGGVMLDDTAIDMEDLGVRIAAAVASDNTLHVVVRGDKDVDYGRIVQALDEIKAAGAAHISLATQRKK